MLTLRGQNPSGDDRAAETVAAELQEDGLANGTNADRETVRALDATVSRLAPRWFVTRDAHAGGIHLLHPRGAMSFLRGPMTRGGGDGRGGLPVEALREAVEVEVENPLCARTAPTTAAVRRRSHRLASAARRALAFSA